MSGAVTVTRADRDAADEVGALTEERRFIVAEAFARHRHAAEAASKQQIAELRDALLEVIDIADSHGAMNYVGSARRIEAARAKATEQGPSNA